MRFFSLVVKHTLIRVILEFVTMHDMELEQPDVKTALFHGDLEEEIYMQQLKGFKEPSKEDYVCLLKRSLYGLKQSPRKWYKWFDSFMITHGYMTIVFILEYLLMAPTYFLLYMLMICQQLQRVSKKL